MKKSLFAIWLCLSLAGCGLSIPGWSVPGESDPVTPDTPVTPAVIDVHDIVKPADDMGLGTSVPPLFASYRDQAVAKRDAAVLAAMYAELADLVERDGAAKKKLTTTDDLVNLQGAQADFMLLGTDFNSITRRYPNVVAAFVDLDKKTLPESAKLDDGTPTNRSKFVNLCRSKAWGCYQASK
jgi:hypothetical protein